MITLHLSFLDKWGYYLNIAGQFRASGDVADENNNQEEPCAHALDPLDEYLAACLSRELCPSSSNVVFMLGDSHLSAHYQAMQLALDGSSVGVLMLGQYCAGSGFKATGNTPETCVPYFDAVIPHLEAQLQPGDAVTFSWAQAKIVRPGYGWDSADFSLFLDYMSALADLTGRHNASLLLIGDHPSIAEGLYSADEKFGVGASGDSQVAEEVDRSAAF